MVESSWGILVHKYLHSRHSEFFVMIQHFESSKSEQCKMIMPLSFTTGLSVNQAE